MVSDRKIVASNGRITVELTDLPFTVKEIKGFDRLEVQIVTSQGFNQDGATLINDFVNPREMEIDGQLYADDTVHLQNLRDKMMNLFLPKTDITINHYYGGRNRIIVARVEETPEFQFTSVSKLQNYRVRLIAAEPYWRDVSETLVQMADVVGDFHFPLVIPIDEGVHFGIKSTALIANVYNQSPINTGMRIDFIANGKVTNPQLFNINTRKYIKILCEMEAGDKVTVKTGDDKTVYRIKNGILEDFIGRVDLAGGGNTFLELEPGDNLFRYAADTGQEMLELKIYYCNKYMGV
ncbi:MAG: phage tail domain-containing protein [Lachnospiraceae bacterium]